MLSVSVHMVARLQAFALPTNSERIGQCGACPSGRAASGAVQCGGNSVGGVKLWKNTVSSTDVFFYTDLTNPYAGYVLNLQKA